MPTGACSPQKHGPFIREAWVFCALNLGRTQGAPAEKISAMGPYGQAQFGARCHHNSKEIYSCVGALQHLADMAWPSIDHYAKGDMVVDQFLQGLDSHELSA